jgi:poly-D-alanine transfer protein DltD
MNQIYCDNQLSDSYKAYYADYIKRKYGQINSPSNTINQFYTYNDNLYAPFNFMYEKVSQSSYEANVYNKLLLNLSKDTVQYRFQNFKSNWDSLYQSSIEEFKKTSTNNDFGVENEYYSNWLKGKSDKIFKITENSQEYQDFKMLLRLCKELKCKPIFIIMPLNTLAYKNAKELEPTIKNIKNELNQYDFKCLDMFNPALNQYQIGTTEDVMHPGNYGWYQMDKFIIEEFSSK